jgi:hypothetical protein
MKKLSRILAVFAVLGLGVMAGVQKGIIKTPITPNYPGTVNGGP